MLFRNFALTTVLMILITTASSTAFAQTIRAEIVIERMLCRQSTDDGVFNDRDEAYILVGGKTPLGSYSTRLPRSDDYYEFWKGTRGETRGWTNKNQQHQRKPTFWSGQLSPGESATFVIALCEQDNKSLKGIVGYTVTAAGVVADAFGAGGAGSAFANAARNVNSKLPYKDRDPIIGIIGVRITNNGGKLVSQWGALKDVRINWNHPEARGSFGPNSELFECDGEDDADYHFIANAIAR